MNNIPLAWFLERFPEQLQLFEIKLKLLRGILFTSLKISSASQLAFIVTNP